MYQFYKVDKPFRMSSEIKKPINAMAISVHYTKKVLFYLFIYFS